jgi:transcription elongation factor SPT5
MQEDAEKIARDLQERYSRAQGARFKGDVDQVPQRLLMPSVEDPNLWQVKCKVRLIFASKGKVEEEGNNPR